MNNLKKVDNLLKKIKNSSSYYQLYYLSNLLQVESSNKVTMAIKELYSNKNYNKKYNTEFRYFCANALRERDQISDTDFIPYQLSLLKKNSQYRYANRKKCLIKLTEIKQFNVEIISALTELYENPLEDIELRCICAKALRDRDQIEDDDFKKFLLNFIKITPLHLFIIKKINFLKTLGPIDEISENYPEVIEILFNQTSNILKEHNILWNRNIDTIIITINYLIKMKKPDKRIIDFILNLLKSLKKYFKKYMRPFIIKKCLLTLNALKEVSEIADKNPEVITILLDILNNNYHIDIKNKCIEILEKMSHKLFLIPNIINLIPEEYRERIQSKLNEVEQAYYLWLSCYLNIKTYIPYIDKISVVHIAEILKCI